MKRFTVSVTSNVSPNLWIVQEMFVKRSHCLCILQYFSTILRTDNRVQEIIIKLNQDNDLSRVQETDTFSHFAELLMRQQALMSGKSRSERFASDDESIIKRHGDGLNSYFGTRNINDITTYDVRNYISHLDSNRDKPYWGKPY